MLYRDLRGLQPFTFWNFIKQVAIDVEREEDEGGTVGETFTDYVSIPSIDLRLLSSAYRYQN